MTAYSEYLLQICLEGSIFSGLLSVHVNGYFRAVAFSVFCSCSFFVLVERVLPLLSFRKEQTKWNVFHSNKLNSFENLGAFF